MAIIQGSDFISSRTSGDRPGDRPGPAEPQYQPYGLAIQCWTATCALDLHSNYSLPLPLPLLPLVGPNTSGLVPHNCCYHHWSNRPFFHGSAHFRPCRISCSSEHFHHSYSMHSCTPTYILRPHFAWNLVCSWCMTKKKKKKKKKKKNFKKPRLFIYFQKWPRGCYDFFTLATRRSFFTSITLWKFTSATRHSPGGLVIYEVCARRGVLKVGHVTSSRDYHLDTVKLFFIEIHSEYNFYVSYPIFW